MDDFAKSWATVTWEEVVERNPEVIVIVNYGEVTADDVVINGRIVGRVRGLKVRLTSTARVEPPIQVQRSTPAALARRS